MKYTADELKPKRYPQDKPSEDGLYWCHHHTLDYWQLITWSANVWTYFSEYEQASVFCLWVDWFIPYRLDEPDESETQGYDVTGHIDQPSIKGRVLWHDEHIEIADLDGFDDTFMIASVTNPERYVFVTDKQLKQCHKAVKERKPEIKACPYCGGECIIKLQVNRHGDNFCNVVCVSNAEGCGYESKWLNVKSEAIRLHNLISGK